MAETNAIVLRSRASGRSSSKNPSNPADSRNAQHESTFTSQRNNYGSSTMVKILSSPSVFALPLAGVIAFVVLHFANTPSMAPRLWSEDELAKYNGTDEKLPILLGILGSVFDVTRGRTHYGVGGSYNHFAGRDASRAFVTGNFTGAGLTDNMKGLSSVEVKSVVDWRGFYHRTYTFSGKLVGRYYNIKGEPTKELKGIEAKAARGAQLLAKRKAEEEKLPNCNSKWSQETGGEVWCESGYPRLVPTLAEIAISGKISKRCVCLKTEELNHSGSELYEGCDPYSSLCKVS